LVPVSTPEGVCLVQVGHPILEKARFHPGSLGAVPHRPVGALPREAPGDAVDELHGSSGRGTSGQTRRRTMRRSSVAFRGFRPNLTSVLLVIPASLSHSDHPRGTSVIVPGFGGAGLPGPPSRPPQRRRVPRAACRLTRRAPSTMWVSALAARCLWAVTRLCMARQTPGSPVVPTSQRSEVEYAPSRSELSIPRGLRR
jgi:hypothetical protein